MRRISPWAVAVVASPQVVVVFPLVAAASLPAVEVSLPAVEVSPVAVEVSLREEAVVFPLAEEAFFSSS